MWGKPVQTTVIPTTFKHTSTKLQINTVDKHMNTVLLETRIYHKFYIHIGIYVSSEISTPDPDQSPRQPAQRNIILTKLYQKHQLTERLGLGSGGSYSIGDSCGDYYYYHYYYCYYCYYYYRSASASRATAEWNRNPPDSNHINYGDLTITFTNYDFRKPLILLV